jgi:hypothetical protein
LSYHQSEFHGVLLRCTPVAETVEPGKLKKQRRFGC